MNWINIKKELPKRSQEVLVCIYGSRDLFVAHYSLTKNLFEVYGAGQSPITDMKVTHWMNLPEPPKD